MHHVLTGIGLYLLGNFVLNLVLIALFLPSLIAARRIWLGERIGTRVVVREWPPASGDEIRHVSVVAAVNLLALVLGRAGPSSTIVLAVGWGAALLLAGTVPQWRPDGWPHPALHVIENYDHGC